MTFDPYAALGVDRTADGPAIKRAYRRKAKQHHPDSGAPPDPEKFHAASRAVAILMDPLKRKRYDETGQIDESSALNDPLAPARELILNFFMAVVASPADIFAVDLIEKCREQMTHHIAEIQKAIQADRNKIARFHKIEKRLRHKDENDFVRRACRAQVADLERMIARHEEQIEIRNQALALLKDYAFEFDAPRTTLSFVYTA